MSGYCQISPMVKKLQTYGGTFLINSFDCQVKIDELVKSPKTVIPAKAGIHK